MKKLFSFLFVLLLMSVLLVGCSSGSQKADWEPLPTEAQSQQVDLSGSQRETHPGEAVDAPATPETYLEMEPLGEISKDSLSVVGADDPGAGYLILDFSNITVGECYADGNPVELKNPGDLTLEIFNSPRSNIVSDVAMGLYNTETMQAYGCICHSTDLRNAFLTTEALPAGTYEFFVQHFSGEITVGLVTYRILENDPA